MRREDYVVKYRQEVNHYTKVPILICFYTHQLTTSHTSYPARKICQNSKNGIKTKVWVKQASWIKEITQRKIISNGHVQATACVPL